MVGYCTLSLYGEYHIKTTRHPVHIRPNSTHCARKAVVIKLMLLLPIALTIPCDAAVWLCCCRRWRCEVMLITLVIRWQLMKLNWHLCHIIVSLGECLQESSAKRTNGKSTWDWRYTKLLMTWSVNNCIQNWNANFFVNKKRFKFPMNKNCFHVNLQFLFYFISFCFVLFYN